MSSEVRKQETGATISTSKWTVHIISRNCPGWIYRRILSLGVFLRVILNSQRGLVRCELRVAALINWGILEPFSLTLFNQLWFLYVACGSSPSRLTRQRERLDRSAVNAKKFDATSVESHSMPGGHAAGVAAPSQRALYFSFLSSQMWQSSILSCKYHHLYNTPAIVDTCS